MIHQISNLQEEISVTEEMNSIVAKVVNEVAICEEVDEKVEVSIALVNDNHIRELNLNYRGKDCSTDVLSFAFRDSDEDAEFEDFEEFPEEQEELLGDVIISLETAQRQAAEYGHSFERELAFLTLHGLLHLLGYDHIDESQQKEMRNREEAILNRLSYVR